MDRIVAPRRPTRLPVRELLTLLSAIAVVVTMIVVSETARDGALHHQRVQLLLERMRSDSADLGVLTDIALRATTPASAPSSAGGRLVAHAESLFTDLTATLRALHAAGATRETAQVSADFGTLAAVGPRSLPSVQAGDPSTSDRARAALDTVAAGLDRDATAAAHRQAESAASALHRSEITYIGSLAVGLALLLLLGARLIALRRRTLVSEGRELARGTEERLRALVENLSDIITVIGPDLTVRWQSSSVARALGRGPDALVGQSLLGQVHPEDLETFEGHLRAIIAGGPGGPPVTFRARGLHASGEWRHLEVVADNRLGTPAIDGIVLSTRDVTERTRLEAELRHQAFHDTLTGLANRALFEDRLTHALASARRAGQAIAVLFCDLDDFKTINDSLGHAAGDELLRAVAVRIASTVRACDTAARLGGDEFAVLLDPLEEDFDAALVAGRLLEALRPPVEVAGRLLRVTASVGVATADGTVGVDELLRNADTAMYAAKEEGKNTVQAFDEAMHRRVVQRLETTGELRIGLAEEQFELDFQPIIALGTRSLAGVEALVRWAHPTRGRLAPGEFIGLAEDTGLIGELGDWVLREACAQTGRWAAAHPGRPLRVGVNVSARQLEDEALPERVAEALRAGGLAPNRLVLEITESVLPEDAERTIAQLAQLKALGVTLALDDFGTGYSSLARLHRYPIDIVKIDRSFIARLEQDGSTSQLVQGIVNLSEGLELDVVAEGIETEAQACMLDAMRVSHAQGHLFARPVSAARIDEMLVDIALASSR